MADDSVNVAEATPYDLVSPVLRNNQVWVDLVAALNEVMALNIDGPVRQLETLRYLPPDADQQLLADACRMLGFDLSQDVLNLSVDNFTKIATQLGMYPDNNGTEQFTKFISLLINGFCEVEYLWSKDYVNFYTQPQGETIENGGLWFKTTHVELSMGFLSTAGLELGSGQTLFQKTKELFYKQAPITLVIDRSYMSVDTEVEFCFGARLINNAERIHYL